MAAGTGVARTHEMLEEENDRMMEQMTHKVKALKTV